MIQAVLVSAVESSGMTADSYLRWLSKSGPPFIFGSRQPPPPSFLIGDQPFTVVRTSTREEFIARHESNTKFAHLVSYFFEAVTD